jgi:hypothetical protein
LQKLRSCYGFALPLVAEFAAMLKTYRKTDAPAWERKIVMLMAFLLGATLLLFTVWAIIIYLDLDGSAACVEEGGIWYEGECIREEVPDESRAPG